VDAEAYLSGIACFAFWWQCHPTKEGHGAGVTLVLMRERIRRVGDLWFPWMARRYRATRDNLLLKRARPCETTFGFRLYGGAGLDTSIRASGELDTFLALLAHCELVVDVGANVGLFTLLALRHGRRVVAVEPSPGNLALLYRNVVLDGVEEDLEIFPIALAARPGLGPLYGGGPGASLLRGWGSVKAPYETVVPLNTLDNVVRARRARMLIKVDVEGSEWSVLQGASETLDDDHGEPRPHEL
jgi:FkbM family methyltransferase